MINFFLCVSWTTYLFRYSLCPSPLTYLRQHNFCKKLLFNFKNTMFLVLSFACSTNARSEWSLALLLEDCGCKQATESIVTQNLSHVSSQYTNLIICIKNSPWKAHPKKFFKTYIIYVSVIYQLTLWRQRKRNANKFCQFQCPCLLIDHR